MLLADKCLANRSLADKTDVMKQIPTILTCFVVSLTLFGGETSPRDYRGDIAINPSPDGNYYLEAEEFQPTSKGDAGWQSKTWGQN